MNFVSIHVGGQRWDLPGATPVSRAAQRVAEGLGYDPETPSVEWRLAKGGRFLLPDDAVIADYDGERLVLLGVER